MASLWNPDNIKDVAESVGVNSLNDNVAEALAQEVEYRISQVLEEALKFMRHAKRTTLGTQDISNALRVLDVEPLYGYESTRPLRFGEAPLGSGQSLFYVEDEEVDFEKMINAPLPKVPREISFTAHWLAVEGVQPSIPQNPTTAESRHQELLPKGPGASTLAATSGADNVAVKPQVKHVLSKELQLLFDRLTSAILASDENTTNTNGNSNGTSSAEDLRFAALQSLRTDPGLHQLVPYFGQFIQEKVTHKMADLFTLTQMMHMTSALFSNPSLYVAPYVMNFVVSVLTCTTGKHLGSPNDPREARFGLRDLGASILIDIAKRFGKSTQSLKPRLLRTCLKEFLSPNKPFGTHYGALRVLLGLTGADGMRTLIIPNLKSYDAILAPGLADEAKRGDAEMVLIRIFKGMEMVAQDAVNVRSTAMQTEGEGVKAELIERLGEVVGSKVFDTHRSDMITAALETDINL